MPAAAQPTAHAWKFYRIGGLDQAVIETGDDLRHLGELDQKLWVALSCPVKGLELDEKTLALIDTDGDGRIRVPELLGAVRWAADHLRDAGDLLQGRDTLPLAAFNPETTEGRTALAAAREILAGLGRPNATEISLADVTDTARFLSATKFNGDGVVTVESAGDDAMRTLIADILATQGGTPDRSAAPGIDQVRADAFFAACTAHATWCEAGTSAEMLALGAGTAAAAAAIAAVRAKADDYFARVRLAAFDSRALGALNRAEADYAALAARDLTVSAQEVAGWPLAAVAAGRSLPLFEGVNPAWAGALTALHRDAVTPVFGAGCTALTEAQWTHLKAKVAAHEAWRSARAGASVESLGLARVQAILAAGPQPVLRALIAKDAALAGEFAAITAVEKLLRYARDFRALLNNFVNFTDFYSPEHYATFQAGTLFLDSRSCELCIRVDAPSPLAAMSKAYIAYLECRRAGCEPMKIAACFTQGDSDYLFVGRNGVFYDRRGRDWDATITNLVDQPISIHQAFWSPYKKLLRLFEEQVARRAAEADAEASTRLAAAADSAAAARPEAPRKLDLALITGMGVALGSIGTFLGVIFTKFLDLPTWKMPLILVGLMLTISLPSMIIAWLKLRQRTLGPILEGNGWAVNGRVKINIPFGTKLTARAQLPANARRRLEDPYEDKAAARQRRIFVTLVVLLGLGLGAAKYFATWPFAPEPAAQTEGAKAGSEKPAAPAKK